MLLAIKNLTLCRMTKSFWLISVCFALLLALLSCSSKVLPAPLLKVDSEMQKFSMQISFKKQNFSGMLIVQRRAENEIRIVASAFFGPTLFDFGLRDEVFNVYSCIEPLRNNRIIKLFEHDFKKLFLPNQKFRKIELNEEFAEKISGRNFGKSIFRTYSSSSKDFKMLTIKHPWIGVSISLERL